MAADSQWSTWKDDPSRHLTEAVTMTHSSESGSTNHQHETGDSWRFLLKCRSSSFSPTYKNSRSLLEPPSCCWVWVRPRFVKIVAVLNGKKYIHVTEKKLNKMGDSLYAGVVGHYSTLAIKKVAIWFVSALKSFILVRSSINEAEDPDVADSHHSYH